MLAVPVSLAVAWWVWTKRRAAIMWRCHCTRIRKGWAQTATAAGLCRQGAIPRITRIDRSAAGTHVALDFGATGLHRKEAVEAAPRLAAIWRASAVEVILGGTPGTCILAVRTTDLLSWDNGAGPEWPWRNRRATRSGARPRADRVPVGLDQEAQPVRLDLGLSLLVAGASGSGKSSLCQLVIAGLALGGHTLYLVDPNRTEARAWVPVAERSVLGLGDDLTQLADLVEEVVEVLDDRTAQLEELGLRKAPDSWPRVVVFIDELAAISAAAIAGGKTAQANYQRFSVGISRILREGRKVCTVVVAATQKADQASVGPFRDLFPLRFAGSLPTAQSSDMALGDGYREQGFDASALDPARKGIGYLASDGAPAPQLMRSFCLTDGDIADIAARCAQARTATIEVAPWVTP